MDAIELVFEGTTKKIEKKSLRDLTGRITLQEAEAWEKIIEETSEKIFEDDWK